MPRLSPKIHLGLAAVAVPLLYGTLAWSAWEVLVGPADHLKVGLFAVLAYGLIWGCIGTGRWVGGKKADLAVGLRVAVLCGGFFLMAMGQRWLRRMSIDDAVWQALLSRPLAIFFTPLILGIFARVNTKDHPDVSPVTPPER